MVSEDFGIQARKAPALLRWLILLGLVFTALLAGRAPTASAAVTGVELTVTFSAENSSNKTATVTCPEGERVVGAGAQLLSTEDLSPSGQVVLGAIRPDPTLTSVTTQGREDQSGVQTTWTVRADAVCAPPPPGLQRVVAASPSNSANKSITASCPTGKRLLGFGADTDGGGGQVAPNDVIPGSALKSVTVTALEDEDGTTANWRVRAYAICAAPVAGLERVVATSASDSEDKIVDQPCPDGKQLLSAGAELAGGAGEVVINDLVASANTFPPGTQFPNAGVVFAAEDEDGTSANWTARVFSVCADEATRAVGPSPAPNFPFGDAPCPSGTNLTGGGGDVTDGLGQVFITGLFPSSASVHVETQQDSTGAFFPWTVRAYAICAPALPGIQVVAGAPSATDSSSPKSASATCPPGKRVIDAGGAVMGGSSEVVMTGARADAGLTGVTASGAEDETGFAGTWNVRAFAVCANPPPGLELVSATTDPNSDPTGVTATCPSGKNLLGMGSSIADGLGQVVLDDVRPNAALTTTAVTALEDENAFSGAWTLTAQAICANP